VLIGAALISRTAALGTAISLYEEHRVHHQNSHFARTTSSRADGYTNTTSNHTPIRCSAGTPNGTHESVTEHH
jgi:hypothetical protein